MIVPILPREILRPREVYESALTFTLTRTANINDHINKPTQPLMLKITLNLPSHHHLLINDDLESDT